MATATPEWLADEELERIQRLGAEMLTFLDRRRRAKRRDPNAVVEPHRRLLKVIEEARRTAEAGGRDG